MVENIFGTIIALLGTLGISFVIEKSPIKINPLSIIKKFLIGDVEEKVENINKKVDNINNKVDENEKDRIRETILQYKKSLDNGIFMSEHEYEYILKIFDKYRLMGGNSFVCGVVSDIKTIYKNQKK